MEQDDLQRQLTAATARVSELEAELKKAKGEELDRVQKVEAQLIEQDHRLPHIAWNLFKRGRPGSTDPLRHAARKAFVWFWFKPTTLAVAAGGIAAWITVYLLYQQNTLVGRQTDAVIEQNQKFDAQLQQISKQLKLQEAKDKAEREADYETRKAQLLAIIYDTDQKWPWSKPEPKAPLRVRQEAAASLIDLQDNRHIDVNLSEADLPNTLLTSKQLERANFSGANMRSSLIDIVFLNAALLIGANLSGAYVGDAELSGANLSDANLRGSLLSKVKLSCADLRGADLCGAILNRVDLRGANLTGANLADVELTDVDLGGAYLYGATFSLDQVDRSTFEFAIFDFIGNPADRP